jgi:hypothetical protein
MGFADDLAVLTGNFITMIGLSVAVYHPVNVLLGDGNIVPDEVVRVGNTTGTFQLSRQAQDQAQAIGIFGTTVALAVFPATAEEILCLRAVLVDAKRRVWLIRSPPSTPEIGKTVDVVYLVSLIDPDNLPDGISA